MSCILRLTTGRRVRSTPRRRCQRGYLKVSAGSDSAVASYRFVVRIQADGIDVNRRYRTTNVWMKRQGRWQIVAAHTGFVLSPKQAASLAGEAS